MTFLLDKKERKGMPKRGKVRKRDMIYVKGRKRKRTQRARD